MRVWWGRGDPSSRLLETKASSRRQTYVHKRADYFYHVMIEFTHTCQTYTKVGACIFSALFRETLRFSSLETGIEKHTYHDRMQEHHFCSTIGPKSVQQVLLSVKVTT